jgi:NAD(P)-dependent dehydrogenase (short-subunit alcohol dehydrogenase family)
VSRSRQEGIAWTPQEVPDLTGRRALVTGVTSGLGEATVLELVGRGAEVVMAARHQDKLAAAVADVQRRVPAAVVHPLRVDLADLTSVRRAADEAAAYGPLHLLVNNAGVMGTAHQRTPDGFELQLATNHLGPFALTGLLLDRLVAAGGRPGDARVVTVSSIMATSVRTVPLDDPREQHGRYRRWRAYGESKLANLLFTLELDRRARAAGLPVLAVAAHPGYTHTNLVRTGMRRGGSGGLRVDGAIGLAVTRLVGQSPEDGALPTLMAATAPGLPGGSYVGPAGPFGLHGPPTLVGLPGPALDTELARALWELSERATGVSWPRTGG